MTATVSATTHTTPCASIDIEALAVAVHLIEQVEPDNRLLQLENIITNNGGYWLVPSSPPDFTHIFLASYAGVSAAAEHRNDLPRNWLIEAKRILSEC